MSGVEELELAEAAFAAQDFSSAIQRARAALADKLDVGEPDSERGEYWPRPQTSRAELIWGMALLEIGERAEALQHVDRAVDLDRDNLRTWSNRAHLRRERGEFELALADLDVALKRDPSYAYARFRRAQALLDLGREEEAEANLAMILTRDPYDEGPLALWRQLRAKRGLAGDSGALPAPKDYAGVLQRGVCFMQHGEPARALADYDAAHAMSQDINLLAYRGMAQQALGNFTAARADLETFLSSNPPSPEYWRALLAEVVQQLEPSPTRS